MSAATVVRAHGGALPYRALDEFGVSRAAVASAVRRGRLVQVRERWFAVPDAPVDVVRAVRVGGSLTASSVARLEGLWVRDDPLLHVRVPRSAGRLWSPSPDGPRVPLDRDAHRVCVHYRTVPGRPTARDDLVMALAEMARCAPRLDAQIAIDSALSLGRIGGADLAALRELVGASRRGIVDLADAGCQSGVETIVRLMLHGHRVRHRTQVRIDGVGRVDVLVGDRLVIEIDGQGFHTGPEFERDRRRDFELMLRGYLVVRVSYAMVMREWDAVRGGLLELIERGDHRWGGRARPRPRDPRRSLARRHITD
ncbi:type IV toxin-antitoxin system AbiEi family antitoxin domain-containing protein [Agromyces tropicus]|uniref:Type IV toxin-antitoxin system AbiEi family antitoxin domain-containing protein n=1 Tax=Agromyces tropicus TaxID=555371 RepID=A0ABN2UP28_9MICO